MDPGILLDYMVVAPGEALRAAELLSPRIEAEIAFRLGRDLCGADVVEDAARGAVAEVFLALEVIDSRFHLEGITLADSVADNAGCARFVLGDAVPMPSWDLRAERLTVCSGSTPVAVGEGRDVLGAPHAGHRRRSRWGSTMTSCCWTSTKPRASAPSSTSLVPSTPRIKIRSGCTFCLQNRLCAAALPESDSADAVVGRIETLKTSSED